MWFLRVIQSQLYTPVKIKRNDWQMTIMKSFRFISNKGKHVLPCHNEGIYLDESIPNERQHHDEMP